MAKSNNSIETARATAPEYRMTGEHDRGPLAQATARRRQPTRSPAPRAETQPKPPVMFVGRLKGLSPERLLVSQTENGPGSWHSTANVDFRRVAGFKSAAQRAVAGLGYTDAANAEIEFVDNNVALLEGIKRSGTRQTIYLGHALGPGGLEPAGLDTKPVAEAQLLQAVANGAPPPILVGCFGADVAGRRPNAPPPVVGLRRFLRWKGTSTDVTEAGMRRRGALKAGDLRIRSIELVPDGKQSAPDVPWTPREAGPVP